MILYIFNVPEMSRLEADEIEEGTGKGVGPEEQKVPEDSGVFLPSISEEGSVYPQTAQHQQPSSKLGKSSIVYKSLIVIHCIIMKVSCTCILCITYTISHSFVFLQMLLHTLLRTFAIQYYGVLPQNSRVEWYLSKDI